MMGSGDKRGLVGICSHWLLVYGCETIPRQQYSLCKCSLSLKKSKIKMQHFFSLDCDYYPKSLSKSCIVQVIVQVIVQLIILLIGQVSFQVIVKFIDVLVRCSINC
jgi:hypothetical protein